MDQKRTWIYCRVDNGSVNCAELLEMQRHGLESYAKEHELQIVGFSSDTGNGLALDRPGLKAFLSAAECGNLDVLLLHNLDRLGRGMKNITAYLKSLRNHGVHVHTAANGEVDLDVYERCFLKW